MNFSGRFVAGLTLATCLTTGVAIAQDAETQAGTATITAGGGIATLTLPDVESFLTGNNGISGATNRRFMLSEDFSREIGWNFNAGISAPIGTRTVLSVAGFWARIEDEDFASCTESASSTCNIFAIVDNPTGNNAINSNFLGSRLSTDAERQVDQWGVAIEAKWLRGGASFKDQPATARRYFSIGGDVRGIYQDLDVTLREDPTRFTQEVDGNYSEDLDTTYYGVFAAYGGEYTPFLFSGLYQRLGLQTSFRVYGGVYYADTEYDGVMTDDQGPGGVTSNLSLSRDDAAFIGGVSLETRRQLGARTTLSLLSTYEYYSFVPEMRYAARDVTAPGDELGTGDRTTSIGNSDAWSLRTSLRLTIGLGGREVYEEPLK